MRAAPSRSCAYATSGLLLPGPVPRELTGCIRNMPCSGREVPTTRADAVCVRACVRACVCERAKARRARGSAYRVGKRGVGHGRRAAGHLLGRVLAELLEAVRHDGERVRRYGPEQAHKANDS